MNYEPIINEGFIVTTTFTCRWIISRFKRNQLLAFFGSPGSNPTKIDRLMKLIGNGINLGRLSICWYDLWTGACGLEISLHDGHNNPKWFKVWGFKK